MITCIVVNGLPEDIREISGAYLNHSSPSLSNLIELGRRIYVPSTQVGIITSHWEDDGTNCTQVVDSAKTPEEIIAAEQKVSKAASAMDQVLEKSSLKNPEIAKNGPRGWEILKTLYKYKCMIGIFGVLVVVVFVSVDVDVSDVEEYVYCVLFPCESFISI
jgi:hypothetical protein